MTPTAHHDPRSFPTIKLRNLKVPLSHFGATKTQGPAVHCLSLLATLLLLLLNPDSSSVSLQRAEALGKGPWIGVNYGTEYSKPLSAATVVASIRARGATGVKLFRPDREVLTALKGTGLRVLVAAPNNRIHSLATKPSSAFVWFDRYIAPFVNTVNFMAIAVGNEVMDPTGSKGSLYKLLVRAMENMHAMLKAKNLDQRIKVVTPLHQGILSGGYPPSTGEVLDVFKGEMTKLLRFINETDSFAVLNFYPVIPYTWGGSTVDRDLVMFRGLQGYYDGSRYYQNLLDAMIDAALFAFGKLGFPKTHFIIGETGWPTAGAATATVSNARDYIAGLVAKVRSGRGTPLRPNNPLKVFIFEMFDEDLKDTKGGAMAVELHWGLLTTDGKAKYPFSLTSSVAPPVAPPQRWCRQRRAATKGVSSALGWACNEGGVNCPQARRGCPEHLVATAVFNAYYQMLGQRPWGCDFAGVAEITHLNPVDPPFSASCRLPGKPVPGKQPLVSRMVGLALSRSFKTYQVESGFFHWMWPPKP